MNTDRKFTFLYPILAGGLVFQAVATWLPRLVVDIIFTVANLAAAVYLLSCWLRDRRKAQS